MPRPAPALTGVLTLGLLAGLPVRADDAQVQRGAFLVKVGGCNDCHTPLKVDPAAGPMPDFTRMLSGHPEGGADPAARPGPGDLGVIGPTFTAFAMPFGVVYSPNLTPDRETGLGGWTEAMFISVFRTGRLHGAPTGRPLLPPMPWRNLADLGDADLKAMFAYLRSIPAVRNRVPAHRLAPTAAEAARAPAPGR